MGEISIFEKFNSMMDIAGLKQDVDNAASNSGDFVEVPKGEYEVKVTKIELGETGEKSKTPGMPMAKVWFEILAGDYKGQKIFMNQMLNSGFGIHKMNEFLNSLETGTPVMFENFQQYADLFAQIFAAIDGTAEFQLSYGENKKGYSTYNIVQRFVN
jgi:hypothetical protein